MVTLETVLAGLTDEEADYASALTGEQFWLWYRRKVVETDAAD